MNRYQKSFLINSSIVIIATFFDVIGMINFKDWVNRSEAMRAMEQIGQIVQNYRKENGSVPPESYINSIKEDLPGNLRVGNLTYRGRWISIESPPDEILAYSKRIYRSWFVEKGYIVLRLDGDVEWMKIEEFESLLASQQSFVETEMMKK